MKIRNDWYEGSPTGLDNIFYTKAETIAEVQYNFDYRRNYSAEGHSVTIDGIVEQVIIQDHNNPINEGKTDKKMLVILDSIAQSGSYVVYENVTWLVISNINIVDDAYKTCQIQMCNYPLKFQHPTLGTILSYPCITSSTKLDEETGNVITLGANKKSILLPCNADTLLLKNTESKVWRFYVDKDTSNPTTYKLIGVDTTTYNYGSGGLIELIVEQDVEQADDRKDLGICDYIEPAPTPDPVDPTTPQVVVTLTSDVESNEVKLGLQYNFTASFANEKGEVITNVQPKYSIDNLYNGLVIFSDKENGTATVIVNENAYDLIGSQFTLTCMDMYSGFSSSILLTIVGMF